MNLQNIKIVYDEINWFSKKWRHGLPFEPTTALKRLFNIMPEEIIQPDHKKNVSMTMTALKDEFEHYQKACNEGMPYKPSEHLQYIEHMVREAIKPLKKEVTYVTHPLDIQGGDAMPENYGMAMPMKCLCVNVTSRSFYDRLHQNKQSFTVTKYVTQGSYDGAASLIKFSFNYKNKVVYVLEEKTHHNSFRSFHFAHDFDRISAFNFVHQYRMALQKKRYNIIRSLVNRRNEYET